MLRPILDSMHFETFAFFVPYRTVWDNHEKFHGARTDPADNIDFTIPTSASTDQITTGTLADYMGLPINKTSAFVGVSMLPFRSYNKIWNEWFRNEAVQDSVDVDTDNGPDSYSQYTLLKRGKRGDYFVSCLPWPQRGTAVSLPLAVGSLKIETDAGINEPIGIWSNDSSSFKRMNITTTDLSVDTDVLGNTDFMKVDIADATAATINDIRLAFQTQRLLERDARSGTRYVEVLKAHWKVVSPDFRLQRSEFLGGGSSTISLSPVSQLNAQTTPTENDKVGNLAANGQVSGTHSWTKSFVEHGCVLILGNIRGDITYSQGINRFWSKSTRFEFFYPVLQGIGEQSVLNREIWYNNDANDDLVFGYIGRYDEYRYLPSKLTGLMRPDASGTLASWHLSEDFSSLPTLGASFMQANTGVPLDRAIAVPTEPQFFADFFHEIKAARPLPTYGVPGGIDRF